LGVSRYCEVVPGAHCRRVVLTIHGSEARAELVFPVIGDPQQW